jgi:hypothetical protein
MLTIADFREYQESRYVWNRKRPLTIDRLNSAVRKRHIDWAYVPVLLSAFDDTYPKRVPQRIASPSFDQTPVLPDTEVEPLFSSLLLGKGLVNPSTEKFDYILVSDLGASFVLPIELSENEVDQLFDWVQGFVRHFERINLSLPEITRYFQTEKAVFAQLYFVAKDARPSQAQLCEYAYRLAIDARAELPFSFTSYSVGKVYWDGELKIILKTPPGTKQSREVTHPYLTRIIETLNPDQIMLTIEQLFGRAPTPDDTQVPIDQKLIEYEVVTDRVQRVWINGCEVMGWAKKQNAAICLLALFRESPLSYTLNEFGRRIAASLNWPKEKKFNVSKHSEEIRELFKETLRGADTWLEADPLQWADGVVIQERISGKKASDNSR